MQEKTAAKDRARAERAAGVGAESAEAGADPDE
jgi:hypothetical protein